MIPLDPTCEWPATTRRFHLGDITMYGTLWTDGGMPKGLALMTNGVGSLERGTLGVIGRLVTMGLQHGIPCGDVVRELKGVAFEPAGITGDPAAPFVSSVVDWVARWMEERCAQKEVK